jgi:hypothetical protein
VVNRNPKVVSCANRQIRKVHSSIKMRRNLEQRAQIWATPYFGQTRNSLPPAELRNWAILKHTRFGSRTAICQAKRLLR